MDDTPSVDPAKEDAESPQEKNTDITPSEEKTPTSQVRKTPTSHRRKSPPDYVPGVDVWGVVDRVRLKALLLEKDQPEWATRVRGGALMSLLDFIIRRHNTSGVRVSASLAAEFVSELNRPKRKHQTIRKPLAVLERIGLLKKVRGHIFGPHVKDSAMYVIPTEYLEKKRRMKVRLNPNQVKKLENAEVRYERRLNRRCEWRGQLVADVRSVSLSSVGRDIALRLLLDEKKVEATRGVLCFLKDAEKVVAVTDVCGTIRTNLISCPRELKPELLIGGARVDNCDISHAHHCFLPLLVMGRIDHLREKNTPGGVLDALGTELIDLREFLSEGDYYQKWCVDPSSEVERAEKKKLLTMLLNWPNEKADNNRLYRRMRKQFPQTFYILEDLKRKDHRTISTQFRNYTARVVTHALLELQQGGIPAIPDTDALICPAEAKEVACVAIGRSMYELTGVRCKVGGIRYRPLSE